MLVTFKGFLVGNNHQVDWDGIVALSQAVAVTRIGFVAPRFLWGYPREVGRGAIEKLAAAAQSSPLRCA
jgi:hypothetical protein